MLLLGIILLIAGIAVLAAATFRHADGVGWVLIALGAVLILARVFDLEGLEHAVAFPLALRSHNLKYEVNKRLDRLALWLAIVMPARLRMWVVVDSANTAIFDLHPRPDGYAGPDGLTYEHIYDGARRELA